MKDKDKTKAQLVKELETLREEIDKQKKAETKRKKIEEALRESENKYRSLFTSSRDGIAIANLKGYITDCNQAYADMLGYSIEELRKLTFLELTPAKWHKTNEDMVRDVMELGYSDEFDKEYIRKDGTIFPVLLRTWRIDDEKGNPVAICSIVRDFTERKKSEELLKQSEGKLSAMLQSIGDHMSMLDKDLTIIWANDITKKIFGNDIIGRKCYEIYHRRKEPCEPYPCLTLKAFQDGKIHEHDTQVIDKDGQMMYFHCTANVALRDEEGKPTAVIEVSRDITKRKKAEEALRHAEEKYRSIFDNAVEGIFQTTPEGLILSVNPALALIFGYDSPEDIMNSVKDIGRQLYVDPEKRKEHLRLLNEKGVVKNFEAQMYRKDGSTNWVSINTRIVRDNAGNPLFFEGFVEDITERKQAEQSLKRREQEIRLIAENVPALFSYIDADGCYRFVNKQYKAWFGVPQTEIIGKHLRQVLGETPYELIKNSVEAALSGQKVYFEQYLPYVHGGERWVSANYVPDIDELGKVKGFFALVTDLTERKRIEEALRESEERYRLLFNNVSDAVFVHEVSPDASDPGRFKFIEVNDRACQYLGYSREELLQMSVPQIDAPETLSNVPAIVKKLFTEGRATWEGIHVSKDGRKIHVEISNQLFELYGKPMILSTVRDITERKKAEEVLKESESKFRNLFDMSPLAIALTDVETGRLIDVNETFCEAAKLHKNEIYGHTTTELGFYSQDDRGRFLKEILSYGEVCGLEMDFKVRDGSIVNSLMFSRLVQIHGNTLILNVFQDVTDRKQFEESLKQLMHKHQLILNAAGEGIIGLDLEGQITFANPFAVKTTGYEIEELIGKELHKLVHYQKPDGTPYPYEECPSYETLKTGVLKNIRDEVFFRKDETSFPVRYTSTPIIEEDVIKGAVVTFRDITDRKRLEEQFLQAQKMEAVGHLAGGVAHDFNNILTAIIGYGNLLQMKLKKDDPFQAYVNQILISSEKAANLTHSLLAFSRKQIINLKPVNLNDIVKNVEKLLMRVIGEDIELQTKFIDKDLIIMADSGQIEQVLMNLATNARDAMPDGGLLIISTEVVELDKGYIKTHSISKLGKYAFISVADTGKGIDEKTKELIFEPFFTTKERGRGTGLGLAVVYGIVKQHNGNIDVYSELDKGTTFKIYLPIIEAEVEETKPTRMIMPVGGKETLLLAEDNKEVRNFIKTVLEQFGYKVIEAVNGEDAIERFMENKDKIELLLLDVIMPRKNGKEVYEAVRKTRPDIKALFLSGYTENIIHRKGILEEGLNFVLKPVSPQELLKKIRETLDKVN